MEFLQTLISMGPDDKNIVDIPAPHLRFPGGGLQGTCLKVFHEDVSQNRGQGRTHCCSFYLLIEGLTKLEVRGLQAEFHESAEVRDGDAGSFLKSVILLQAV